MVPSLIPDSEPLLAETQLEYEVHVKIHNLTWVVLTTVLQSYAEHKVRELRALLVGKEPFLKGAKVWLTSSSGEIIPVREYSYQGWLTGIDDWGNIYE
jgi:hypothetical protein